MRITFLTALADASGGNRVIATYAERLQALGVAVSIVTRRPRPLGLKERLRELARGRGWQTHEVPELSHFDRLRVPITWLAPGVVPAAADLPDADVLIATWFMTAEWASTLPASKGRPLHFVQGYEAFGAFSKERVDQALLLPFPKISVSRWLTSILRGLGCGSVTTIANATDMRAPAGPRRKRDHPTVGLVYSPEPIKGPDFLAAAVTRLRERLPDLRVVAFGLERPSRRLRALTSGVFHRAPAQERIPEIYAGADLWLFGSRLDGFGLPILEALACGTPVVATRVGAAEELVAEGRCGHVVGVDDLEGFVAAAGEILTAGATEWQGLSQRALARAEAWSWDRAAGEFLAVLRAMAGRAVEGPPAELSPLDYPISCRP